jgi:heat shock protein HslJ
MGRTFLATVLLLAALFAIGSCATTTPTAPPRLDDTSWRLAAWSISSMKSTDFEITARFGDGGVAGRSAVNTYRANVVLGPGNALAIGPIATTKMAGPEPAMRAEHAYLKLLADARSYRIDGNRLTLFDAGGNERLAFDAVAE